MSREPSISSLGDAVLPFDPLIAVVGSTIGGNLVAAITDPGCGAGVHDVCAGGRRRRGGHVRDMCAAAVEAHVWKFGFPYFNLLLQFCPNFVYIWF